jgi:trimeric autotransporter adhesin
MGLFDSSDTASQDYLKQALAAYQSAAVPTVQSETVGNLPMESVQGTVNPNAIQVATQAPSAYNNIALDPATRAAQMSALGQYTDIANAGGLDPAAKLALQQTIDATNAQSQGAQGAIERSAQAEGQGGGDFALTQRAIAAQGASNTGATQGLETAAMAEANREAALNQMANIGGSVNASDYGQAATKAGAQNTINATNQAATNTANTGNVANAINAGEFNTNTAQGVNAANTAAGQGRVYYNAALPQQQFNNELNKAAGVAGVSGQQANAAQTATAQGNAMTGALLGAAGTIGGAALGGPAGAAAGKAAAGAVAPTSASSKNPNNNTSNLAEGGVVCYADGGVAHDHVICMKLGGHISGKAEVPGDSETNDTVPAMLSPGELVIPRSVPKDGPHMEQFAKNAPVPGTGKKVDLTGFTNGYKKGAR